MANVNANINVNIQTQQAAAQLRKLSADISRFNQQTFAANSAAAQQQRALNQALVDGVRTSGHFRTSIVPMTSAVENFSMAIEKGKLSLGQYTRYAASQLPGMRRVFTREFDMINRIAENRVKKLNTQFIALGESANGMRTALAMTPTALDQFSARSAIALQRQQIFNRLLSDGSTQLLNWGKNTQWAGRQLMVGFTIPLGILGAQAAKVFREIEAEAVNFKKVYGDMFTTDVEVEKNLAAIKELSIEMTKYGQTAQQTMQLANTAAQAGQRGAELMAATREATRLAVLGQMEQNQAIETTISLQTAFALSNEELAESINFLNSVENQTILSLQDVSEAIPRVASVIKGFGGDVGDLSVLLVAMKEGGVSAAEGANALKNSMARVIAPTKRALETSAKYGIALQDIVARNEGKIVPLFQELATALESVGGKERQEILSDIFGKFQYARIGTLLSNIAKDGSQAATAIELTGVAARDLAATAERELGAVEDAVGTKFTAALEKAKIALAPVGEEFLKALTPVLEFAGKILEKFSTLPDGIKTAIVAATGIIGGIAPIVLMVVGLVANGIANIGKFILFLRKQIATLRGNGEQFKRYTSAELEAAAAAASLEGKTSSLTKTMLLQKPAIETLITLYGRLASSARTAALAMPTTMGNIGFGSIRTPRGLPVGGLPTLPQARNVGGPIFRSAGGKTRVPGYGNTDTVPAMLTPGEFVINKKATQENLPLIKAINDGSISSSQSSRTTSGPESGIQYANIGLLMQGIRRISGSIKPRTPAGKVFPKWFYDTSTGTNRSRQKMALEDSYAMGVRFKKPDGSEYTIDEIRAMKSDQVKKIWSGVHRGHMAPSVPFGDGRDYLPGIVGPMLGGGKGGNLSMIRGGNPREIYDMFSSLEARGIHPMSILFGASKELGYRANPALFTRAYQDLMQNLLMKRSNFGSKESFEAWAYKILKRNLGMIENKNGNFFERMNYVGTVRGIDPKRTKTESGSYSAGRGSLFAALLPGFNKGGMVPGVQYLNFGAPVAQAASQTMYRMGRHPLGKYSIDKNMDKRAAWGKWAGKGLYFAENINETKKYKYQTWLGRTFPKLGNLMSKVGLERRMWKTTLPGDRILDLDTPLSQSFGRSVDLTRTLQDSMARSVSKNGLSPSILPNNIPSTVRNLRDEFIETVSLSLRSKRGFKNPKKRKAKAEDMWLQVLRSSGYDAIRNSGGLSRVGSPSDEFVLIRRPRTLRRVSKKEQKRTMSAHASKWNKGGMIPQSETLMANNGTMVPGMGNKDTVPAMLTPGEFVVNKKATEENISLLRAINDGNVQKLAEGDKVGQSGKRSRLPGERRISWQAEVAGNRADEARAGRAARTGFQVQREHTAPKTSFERETFRFGTKPENLMSNLLRAGGPGSSPKTRDEYLRRLDKYFQDEKKRVEKSERTQEQKDKMKANIDKKRDKMMVKIDKNFALNARERQDQAKVLSGMVKDIKQGRLSQNAVSKNFVKLAKQNIDAAKSYLAPSRPGLPGYKPLTTPSMVQPSSAKISGSQGSSRVISNPKLMHEQALTARIMRENPGINAKQARQLAKLQMMGSRGGGGSGGGPRPSASAAAADGPPPRQSMYSRANAAVGRFGMGAGMGISMAAMLPMMNQDEQGKFMGMNAGTAMMGMMGAGTMLSIVPMLGKAALPVMALAAVAAGVGLALNKWRSHIDETSRKTADLGANLGVTANSVNVMAKLLGEATPIERRAQLQLGITEDEQQYFGEFQNYLGSEEGTKFLDDLRTSTFPERVKKMTDYLRNAIATEMFTEQQATAFAKAVSLSLGDAVTGSVVSQNIRGQKTGAQALLDILETRVAAEPTEVIERAALQDSLGIEDAGKIVGFSTQVFQDAANVEALAYEELARGTMTQEEYNAIIDKTTGLQVKYVDALNNAITKTNDLGGTMQAVLDQLKDAGLITDEQQKAVTQAQEGMLASIEQDRARLESFQYTAEGAAGMVQSAIDERIGKQVISLDGNVIKNIEDLLPSEYGDFRLLDTMGIDPQVLQETNNAVVQEILDLPQKMADTETGILYKEMAQTNLAAAVAESPGMASSYIELVNEMKTNSDLLKQYGEYLVAPGGEGAGAFNAILFEREVTAGRAGISGEETRQMAIAQQRALSAQNIQAGDYQAYLSGFAPGAQRAMAVRNLEGAPVGAQVAAVSAAPRMMGAVGAPGTEQVLNSKEFAEAVQQGDIDKINSLADAVANAGEVFSQEEFDALVSVAIEESVNGQGADLEERIPELTEGAKAIRENIPDEMIATMGIDLSLPSDIEKFGPMAKQLGENWPLLENLNPNIDLAASIDFLTMEGGEALSEQEVANRIATLNKAWKDLQSSDPEVRKQALIDIATAYAGTEIVGGKDPATIATEALNNLREKFGDFDKLDPITQQQLILSEINYQVLNAELAAKTAQLEKDLKDELASEEPDVGRIISLSSQIAQNNAEMKRNTSKAEAEQTAMRSAGSRRSGSDGGGGGSQSPVKGFVENIINQVKMWVDVNAKMGDLNNARTKFVDMVLKGDGIFNRLNKVKGIDPMRLQEILSMGPEGAKEFLDKYTKGNKLTKAGKGILDAAAAAGINETIGMAAIQATQTRQQATAAKFLSGRGEGSAVIQQIAGDPRRSAELVRLQKEYNQAVRSGNDKEIEKAEKALNRYIRSQRDSIKAEKEREEQAKSAAQKTIEANNDVIEANNKYIEQGDKHFEKEERRIEKKYRDQIKSAEDQIDSINEQIDAVNDLIDEQEKLNRSDQNRIRDLDRQKEMLNRQLEELDRANELDGRRIETLQREDEMRGRVEEALSRELELMSRAEDDIRDSYQKRIDALDEVAKVNQHIINQQRQQLDLSRAISEGDIYAATAAAQDMRATSANFAVEQVRQGLETGMENQIAGLRTAGGLTREQAEQQILAIQDQSYQASLQIRDIEDAIYNRNLQMIPIKDQIRNYDLQIRDLQDQIYNRETIILGIQTQRLEPLQTSLKDQQDILDKLNKQVETEIEGIKFREMSAEQWADQKLFLIDQNESLENQNTLLEEEDQRLAGISRKLNKIANQMQQINKITNKRLENESVIEAATAAQIKKNEALTDTEKNEALRANAAARQKAREEIEADRQARINALLAQASGISAFAGGLMKYAMGGMISNPNKFTSSEAPPVQRRASGGVVFGNGSRDSIAAMLTPGEFVIRKAMVDKYGIPMMKALNQGSFSLPKYDVESVSPGVGVVSNNMVSNINAPVYNTYDMKFSISGTNQSADEIANKVMFKMQQLQNQGIRSNRGY